MNALDKARSMPVKGVESLLTKRNGRLYAHHTYENHPCKNFIS
jgi:hypothetical protein